MLTGYKDFLVDSKMDEDFARAYDAFELPYTIAKQIIELRQLRGWTQSQLAEKVKTTQSSIARLENMDQALPSLSFVKRVAEALEAEVEVRFVYR